MTYIQDNDGDYTKQCETEGCPNEVWIGVSICLCRQCLDEDDDVEFKITPYFEQRFMI